LYGKVNDLARFFYEFLAYHLVERSAGAVTWEGLIYEMDLTSDGSTRRRSLDYLYNYVRVRFRDPENKIQLTDPASDAESIRIYSKREQVWPIDGQDLAAAEAARDSILKENAWPWARTIGTDLGIIGEASLFVRACGYVWTGNWQYESAGDDTDDALSDWVGEIVVTNMPYLQAGRIVSNVTVVRKKNKMEMRAWDTVTKLLEMGLSDQPARAFVDNDRRFYYEQIETSPMYFKRRGGLYSSPGGKLQVNPWQVRPAVVRDLDYPVKKTELGAWLSDARDWYMAGVEVQDRGDGVGVLIPKPAEYLESDILSAQAAYEEQLRRLREAEEEAAGKDERVSSRTRAWRKFRRTIPGWDEMSSAERTRARMDFFEDW
jgi:hypothetical protein